MTEREPGSFPASRLVSTLSSVIGMAWVGFVFAVWVAAVATSSGVQEGIAVGMILLIFVLWFPAAPGLLVWRFGRDLREEVTADTVCRAIFALSAITVAVPILALLIFMFIIGVGNEMIVRAVITGAVVLVFPIHFGVCRQVLVHDAVPFDGWRDVASKPIVHIASYAIVWISMNIAWRLMDAPSLDSTAHTMLYFLASVIVPIVLGYGFFQIVCRKLGHIETRPRTFLGISYRY